MIMFATCTCNCTRGPCSCTRAVASHSQGVVRCAVCVRMAGQDAIIGFVGADFAMIGTDMNAGRSIIVFNHEEDKIRELDAHKILGVGGDPADCVQEPEYFQKNVALNYYRNNVMMSTHAVANYMRGEKSANLRKGMKVVDMLLGGFEPDVGPTLYFIDYLASMQKLDKGAHGYAGMFTNSLLDAHWKPDMTEAEAVALMDMCIKELHTRFMISMPNWLIKVVDKDGSMPI